MNPSLILLKSYERVDLDPIKKRLSETTKGAWYTGNFKDRSESGEKERWVYLHIDDGEKTLSLSWLLESDSLTLDDAEFIAESKNDIYQLITEVEQLRKDYAALVSKIRKIETVLDSD